MNSFQHKRTAGFTALYLGLLTCAFFCTLPASAQAPSSLAKEMLQTTYPEEFFFTAAPRDVWQALSEEVKLISHTRVLVSETNDLILSWVELPDQQTTAPKPKPRPATVAPANRNGQIMPEEPVAPKIPLSTNDLVRLKETEVSEVGQDRVAVTTAMIMPAPKGSIVRLRRIYYGSHTQPRIAHSTGAFECWLIGRLSGRLSPQTGVK
jgi:hypothetical protein